jgi:AraC family transcriptional regulator, transcriptional activator FtrA
MRWHTPQPAPGGSALRRLLRGLGHATFWIAAALVLPVLVGTASLRPKLAGMTRGGEVLAADELPVPAAHDTARRTAVILLGDSLTEASDFLVPFEVLGQTGLYNVYAVARERRPLGLFPGELAVLPHYSYEEYAQQVGVQPDILVVPYMESDVESAIAARGEFMRRWWTGDNLLVTICGGSWTVARTGVLAGRTATSHRNVLRLVADSVTHVNWVSGPRWVDDGNFVSSAGITSGMDAMLHVVRREHGRAAAFEVARRVGYPHLQYLDDPAFEVPQGSLATLVLGAAFSRSRTAALVMFDGASEIALGALTDTHTRAGLVRMRPVSTGPRVVRTRHGLHLVPRGTLDDVPDADRAFIAGTADASAAAALAAWAASVGVVPEDPGGAGGFAYDVALGDMAATQSPAAARSAAQSLEYPIAHLGLAAALPPPALVVRPVGLALIGLAAAALLLRARRVRTARRGVGGLAA